MAQDAHHQVHLHLHLADIGEGKYVQIHKDHSRMAAHWMWPEIWAENDALNLTHPHLKRKTIKLEKELKLIFFY